MTASSTSSSKQQQQYALAMLARRDRAGSKHAGPDRNPAEERRLCVSASYTASTAGTAAPPRQPLVALLLPNACSGTGLRECFSSSCACSPPTGQVHSDDAYKSFAPSTATSTRPSQLSATAFARAEGQLFHQRRHADLIKDIDAGRPATGCSQRPQLQPSGSGHLDRGHRATKAGAGSTNDPNGEQPHRRCYTSNLNGKDSTTRQELGSQLEPRQRRWFLGFAMPEQNHGRLSNLQHWLSSFCTGNVTRPAWVPCATYEKKPPASIGCMISRQLT